MDAAPGQDDVEIWTFDNRSGGWFHPIHVHLTDFKILDRNGQPPLPYEVGPKDVGPKDVAYAGEGEVVRVIAKFGPRRGKYMMHCHNVIHEDHDMMTNFEAGTGGPDPVAAAPPRAATNPLPPPAKTPSPASRLTGPASPRRSRCTGTGSPPGRPRGCRGACRCATPRRRASSAGARPSPRSGGARRRGRRRRGGAPTSPRARRPARCARGRAGPGRRRGRRG